MWSSCFYASAFLLVAVHADPRKRACDYFDICHTSDPKFNDCVKHTIRKLQGDLVKGIPELNMLPLDPLKMDQMELKQGTSGNFQLHEKVSNIQIFGLSNYTIKYFNFNYDKKQWNYTLSYPSIRVKGDYDIDGKIFVLPLKGNGTMNFLCTNVTGVSKVSFETFENDKQKYTKIKDYKLSIRPEHCEMHFTNLFNGDKRLGDGINRFLNANWKETFDSYKEMPEKAFAGHMKRQINCVLTKFPENEIFPK